MVGSDSEGTRFIVVQIGDDWWLEEEEPYSEKVERLYRRLYLYPTYRTLFQGVSASDLPTKSITNLFD